MHGLSHHDLEGKEVMDPMRKRAILARIDHLVRGNTESGQGLAEYALILALIAIIAIVSLIYLGNQISDKLSIIGSAV
jgi:pilus assembly protein Flp/PilA